MFARDASLADKCILKQGSFLLLRPLKQFFHFVGLLAMIEKLQNGLWNKEKFAMVFSMDSLPIKITNKGSKIYRVDIDANRLERLAEALGFYHPSFLKELDNAEKDIQNGRTKKIQSFRDLMCLCSHSSRQIRFKKHTVVSLNPSEKSWINRRRFLLRILFILHFTQKNSYQNVSNTGVFGLIENIVYFFDLEVIERSISSLRGHMILCTDFKFSSQTVLLLRKPVS